MYEGGNAAFYVYLTSMLTGNPSENKVVRGLANNVRV